jgi:hypothetical protein
MGLAFTNTAATTVAVTNRFVTSTNMKVGAYTIANASPVWSGGCLVTVTVTSVTGADTMGTITIVGTDLAGAVQTETLTPVADSTATSTKVFRTVTSATGAGWVIATGNDTLVIGCAAGNIACGSAGTLGGVLVNNAVAAAVTISDGSRTILTIPASQAAGTYYPVNAAFGSHLKVATTSTNDVTVFHTGTLPSTYA